MGIAVSCLLASFVMVSSAFAAHDNPSEGKGGAAESKAATPPRRLITLAPNITETVFALGRGDRVVGVSEFCSYPPEVRMLPRVGGWSNPNFETLASLEPDLVLLQFEHEKVERFCRERDIPTRHIRMGDLASISSEIQALGDLLAAEPAAQRVVEEIERDLASVRAAAPKANRPRVFLSVERRLGSLGGVLTVGGDTFLHELIEIAGGENVFADARGYAQASKESLLVRRPDVLVEIRPGGKDDAEARARLLEDWRSLPSLPATRNERLRIVALPSALIPGPRVGETAKAIQRALFEK